MKLYKKQELFMRLLPHLILKCHELGYGVVGGDLFRDRRVHGAFGEKGGYGRKKSCHKLKIAIDLTICKYGVCLESTEGHREIGEWWENQHKLCRWGGRYDVGNHYSLKHKGCR